MTEPKPTGTPSAGFDLRIETRLPPDGVAKLELDPGKRHEIVVHVPGGETPSATVPESAKATGGLALPKVGEKWSTSAPTGSGSVAIVVPLPPARGITPQLAIAYSTMGGNGPFGWGWRSSIPFISRTTTKAIVREHGRGVPEYDDAGESDVFVFSDTDELVKIKEGINPDTGAVVVTYRPRTEGGFARIERHEVGGLSHWVVRSADNVLSIYGHAPEARVADPEDPKRVFTWWLQEQRDCLGNVIVYRYKAEDAVGVDAASKPERGRTGPQAQRYLQRILYGNREVPGAAAIDPTTLDDPSARDAFMFEIVLDYGEHAAGAGAGVDDNQGWPARPDAFSSYRAGFEIRTRRLCRRALVFHRFAVLGATPVLVRALELAYEEDAFASRLVAATLVGYDGDTTLRLPSRRFTYTPRALAATVRTIAGTHALDLSSPTTDAELLDLEGDGLAGILTREQGRFVIRAPGDLPGTFLPPEAIDFAAAPSIDPAVHLQRWLDPSSRGRPALIEFGPTTATVYERGVDSPAWEAGVTISAGNTPPIGKNPIAEKHRVYIADLDGDGIADVLVAKADGYTWWHRMGKDSKDGWIEQPKIAHDGDESSGPGPVLFDATRDLAPENTPRTEAIVFADMTGDGLPDVVRLRAGEVAYWPNLGHGRFGGKVVMDGTTIGEPIDHERVRVADVDGLGTTDILYLGKAGTRLLLNACGNRLVAGPSPTVPAFERLGLSALGRIDGRWAASLVIAENIAEAPITIVDFSSAPPYLLEQDDGGMGLRTRVEYETSTALMRADRAGGSPWRTRMPIAIHVVTRVVMEDLVRGTAFTSRYHYRHGHYDPTERELRGFGFVEQTDSESFDAINPVSGAQQDTSAEFLVAPMRRRTWYATGAEVDLSDEYDTSDPHAGSAPGVEQSAGFSDLDTDDRPEARRAMRGRPLREEIFSDDRGHDPDEDLRARPLTVAAHGYALRCVHAKGAGHHASILVWAEQSLAYTYERERVPDPRLVQTAVLEVDDCGNAILSATVAYPRRAAVPLPKTTPAKPPTSEDDGDVVQARVTGFLFDEAKVFVLPPAIGGLRALSELYQQIADDQGGAQVLVVGHTDREGKLADNATLSLARARSVAHFLAGDVDGWLAMYDASVAKDRRFGADEDVQMLAAVGFAGDVAAFQRSAELEDDGDLGPFTRRALIERYMSLGGASLPSGTPVVCVGAGESFPAIATEDSVAKAANRRTEVFFFAGAIDPPAPGELLDADAPAYAAWVARLSRRIDIDADTGVVLDPVGPGGAEPPPREMPDPRAVPSPAAVIDPQSVAVIVVEKHTVVNQREPDVHRIGTVVESLQWEVTGKDVDPLTPMNVAALKAAAQGGTEIPFEAAASGAHERRVIGRTRQLFYDDALGDKPAALGQVGVRALPFLTLQMAMSIAQADALLGDAFAAFGEDPDKTLQAAGYVHEGDGWWIRSARSVFAADKFYRSVAMIDAFETRVQEVEYDEDAYLAVASRSIVPGGPALRTDFANDYRVLAAAATSDPNDTVSVCRFDALGQVVAEVTRGTATPKDGARAFAGPAATLIERLQELGDEGDSIDLPTRRHAYDLHAFVDRGAPASCTTYVKLDRVGTDPRISLAVTYFDGAGVELQRKVRTEGGKFRTSGRTVVNNKGLPIRVYAPHIGAGEAYAAGGGKLVATMHYDALGRCVRTDHPDGTHERTEPGAWQVTTYDRNDTVLDSAWLSTAESAGGASATAAARTKAHANTPITAWLDVLGRACASIERLRDDAGDDLVHVTRQVLDVSGNVTEVIDARGNVAERREHGMLGQVLRVVSLDAGDRVAVADAAGAPLRAIDGKGRAYRCTYDAQRRPLEDWVSVPGRKSQVLLAKRVYGDGANDPSGESGIPGGRHRGRLLRVYDGGGEVRVLAYDMDGSVAASERRLTDLPRALAVAREADEEPHTRADWICIAAMTSVNAIDATLAKAQVLEVDPYGKTLAWPSSATYDALGRAVESSTPSGATIHRRYSEDGALVRIERADASDNDPELVWAASEHDHLGRPLVVRHGEAATTRHTYDPVTERLLRLRCTAASGKAVQDLALTYDAVGNITQIRDGSQATLHFGNAAVEAVNDYRYDALYRLVEASGREHEGQGGAGPWDADPLRVTSPSDPKAMRRYVQRYAWDPVGNIRSLTHEAGTGSYRRAYEYSAFGNRLRATGRAAGVLSERYEHDVHGNMTAMPHVDAMVWDEVDQLERVECGTQTVWLQYAGGERIRKYVEKGEGVVEERLYVDGEELFRKLRGGVLVESTLTEHVGGTQIDTKTIADGSAVVKPKALWRLRVADHLGSVTVELDRDGKVIAREEFHPFGTTSYRAMRSSLDAAANRFRYTGLERDEETGLARHGARYYAAWLCRWTAGDPIGIGDGVNRFAYCGGDPVGSCDTTGLSAEIAAGYEKSIDRRGDVTTAVYLSVEFELFGESVALGLRAGVKQFAQPLSLEGGNRQAAPRAQSAGAHELPSETDAWGLPFDFAERQAAASKDAELDRLYRMNETWAHPQSERPDAVPWGAEPLLTASGEVLWRLADPGTAGDLDNFFSESGVVVARRAHGLEAPDVDPYDALGGGKILVAGVVRWGSRRGLPFFVNGRSAKAVHDEYLEYVRPGATEKTFRPSWTSRSGLGSRRLDDHEQIGRIRIGFEANTTPWARMTREKLAHKLDQASADWTLLKTGKIDRMIWFGTEELPTTGLGGQLRAVLENAGIEYWVVPWR